MITFKSNTLVRFVFSIFFVLSVHTLLYAQQPKNTPLKVRKTWAVIVGVSKFKKASDFRELAYADSDAVAFKNFLLKQKDKIHIDDSQIRLLIDTAANTMAVWRAFWWMNKQATDEDQVIFYFSGHGAKDNEEPYLIAGNHSGPMYEQNGNLSLREIKRYFNMYVGNSGVNVNNVRRALLIVDACSAGSFENLGNDLENPKIVRMYSCYPNTSSVEVDAYKAGLFTHFLLRGFNGAADRDSNNYITPFEINRYLQDSIYLGHNKIQFPEVKSDDQNMIIFEYDPVAWRQQLAIEKTKPTSAHLTKPIKKISSKGNDEQPKQTSENYRKFVSFIKQGYLLFGQNRKDTVNCARYYYERFAANPTNSEKLIDAKLLFLEALQKRNSTLFNRYVQQNHFYFDYWTVHDAVQEMNYSLSLLDLNDRLFQYMKPRAMFMQSMTYSDPIPAIALLHSALAADPGATYAQVGLGSRLLDAGQPDSALIYLNIAQKSSPEWPLIYLQTGLVYMRLQKYDLAEYNLTKLLQLSPDDAYSYYVYGTLKYNRQQYVQAIDFFRKACKIAPTEKGYLDWLANTYFITKDDERAKAAYQKLLSLDPQDKDARLNLAKIANRHADFDNATTQMQALISKDPTQISYYIYLGNTLVHAQKIDEALSNYRAALDLEPQNKEALNAISKIPLDRLENSIHQNGNSVGSIFNKLNSTIGVSAIDKGIQLFGQRRDSSALKVFQDVLRKDSLNRLALEYGGIILRSQQRTKEALSYYQTLAKIKPNVADYRFTLGDIYAKNGQPKDAIGAIRAGLAIDSLRAEQWQNLGNVAYESQDYLTALIGFERASKLSKDNVAAYSYNAGIANVTLKRFEPAIGWFLKCIDKDSTMYDAFRELGNVYDETHAYDKAFFYLKKAQKLNPNDAEIYADLGEVSFELTQDKDALGYYLQAIKLKPENIEYLEGVGRGYLETGDTTSALNQFKIAFEKSASDPWLCFTLGNLYQQRGKNSDAIYYFKKTIAADSSYTEAYNSLAEIYIEQNFTKTPNTQKIRLQALPLYLTALKFDSTSVRTLMGLSHIYYLLGDDRQREHYLEKTILADSTEAYSLEQLADLRYNQDRYDDAFLLYRRAVYADSTSATAYFSLGEIYLDIKDDGYQALKCFEKVAQLDPATEYLEYYTGLAYKRIEQYPLAISSLKKARRRDPDDIDIYLHLGDIYANLGNYTDALKSYAQVSLLAPKNPHGWHGQANIHFDRQQYSQALAYYRKAASLSGSVHRYDKDIAQCYEQLRNYRAAILLARNIHNTTKNTDDLLYLTSLYNQNGQRVESVRLLKDSAAAWKRNNIYLLALGDMSAAAKNYKEAETFYVEAGRINPFDQYFRIGNMYAYIDSAKADLAYRSAIAIDSSLAGPYFNLGILALNGKNYRKAIDFCKKSAELNPDVSYYKQLATLYSKLNDSTAVVATREHLVRMRDDVENERWLGLAYYDYDMLDKGRKALETAYSLNPYSFSDFEELAYLYMMGERYPEAIRWYQKALKTKSQNATIHSNIGFCYIQTKKPSWTEAAIHLKKAIQLKPNSYQAYYNLLYVYCQTGQILPAIALYKSAEHQGVLLKKDVISDAGFEILRKALAKLLSN